MFYIFGWVILILEVLGTVVNITKAEEYRIVKPNEKKLQILFSIPIIIWMWFALH